MTIDDGMLAAYNDPSHLYQLTDNTRMSPNSKSSRLIQSSMIGEGKSMAVKSKFRVKKSKKRTESFGEKSNSVRTMGALRLPTDSSITIEQTKGKKITKKSKGPQQ